MQRNSTFNVMKIKDKVIKIGRLNFKVNDEINLTFLYQDSKNHQTNFYVKMNLQGDTQREEITKIVSKKNLNA